MRKTCSICLKEKDEADFYMNRSNTRDGLHSHCRSCQQVKNAAYKADPLIRSHMLEIATLHPKWTEERAALSLDVHGLTGGLGGRDSRGNQIITIDDVLINVVAISGGKICGSDLLSGRVPGVIAVVRQVRRAIEVWNGIYEFSGIEFDGKYQRLQFKNVDGETRWARASHWISGRDSFADGCIKLSLRELHNGKSNWTYGVRLCDFETDQTWFFVKPGKGRRGQALKEHQGCEIHQIEMQTGWHARVAEAMIHVELMQYHSPLPKGSLPKGGESEVFRVNDMMIVHEVMDHICAEVNSWSLTECESRHPDMSKLCSSTSARLHSRQKRLHPLGCTS